MNRIVSGGSRRAEVSTLLAESTYLTIYNNRSVETHGKLYRTPTGAYFSAEEIQVGVDDDGYEKWSGPRCWALTKDDAREWLRKPDIDII
jgi:hypothetical protein